jgi:hypothetical protein
MLVIEVQRFVGLIEGLRIRPAANIAPPSLKHCRGW